MKIKAKLALYVAYDNGTMDGETCDFTMFKLILQPKPKMVMAIAWSKQKEDIHKL